MHRIAATIIAVAVLAAQSAGAGGDSWNKIRYVAGTIEAKVNPYDYNTKLTVSRDEIVLAFSPRPTVRLEPSRVVSISYGVQAQQRVRTILEISSAKQGQKAALLPPDPPGLFGFLRPKDELVGIVFKNQDGSAGAVLLQTLPAYYQAILGALSMATGKPIEMVK
jgi:hypothetical protein